MGNMPESRARRPPALQLPEQKKRKDDVKLTCDIVEGVVWCNRVTRLDPTNLPNPRWKVFVAEKDNDAMPLTVFMKTMCGLLKKTWPCALWIVDAVSKRLGLPICRQTVRRMVTGAVFLLISTEDEEGMEVLCKAASKRASKVEKLGSAVLRALRADVEGIDLALPVYEEGWEVIIGLHHTAWVRAALPRLARAIDKEVSKRTIHSDVLISPRQHPTVHILQGCPTPLAADAFEEESELDGSVGSLPSRQDILSCSPRQSTSSLGSANPPAVPVLKFSHSGSSVSDETSSVRTTPRGMTPRDRLTGRFGMTPRTPRTVLTSSSAGDLTDQHGSPSGEHEAHSTASRRLAAAQRYSASLLSLTFNFASDIRTDDPLSIVKDDA